MDIIKIIRAEIEKRKKAIHSTLFNDEYNDLLSFLDTLESEKPNTHLEHVPEIKETGTQGLDEAAKNYALNTAEDSEQYSARYLGYKDGAKWQKEQDTVGRVSVEIRSNLQTDEVVRKTLIMLVNDGRISVTGAITNSDILDWLEGQQEPEVDLEKEVGKFWDKVYGKDRRCTRAINIYDFQGFARHFYNLGLKNAK